MMRINGALYTIATALFICALPVAMIAIPLGYDGLGMFTLGICVGALVFATIIHGDWEE